MSCISSSRTAVPLAQAAHSGLTCVVAGMPNTVAPPARGWASAMSRALMQGWRLTLAMATAALSITRFISISVTSGATATGSAATAAIFIAS